MNFSSLLHGTSTVNRNEHPDARTEHLAYNCYGYNERFLALWDQNTPRSTFKTQLKKVGNEGSTLHGATDRGIGAKIK